MSMTLAPSRVTRPNRRPLARVLIAHALHAASMRVSLQPGDPSPCCKGEHLHPNPHRPGWLVCPDRGEQYPARSR